MYYFYLLSPPGSTYMECLHGQTELFEMGSSHATHSEPCAQFHQATQQRGATFQRTSLIAVEPLEERLFYGIIEANFDVKSEAYRKYIPGIGNA